MRFIPLFSGSSGNCSVIQTEKATLLVDAGLTGKAVCGALASAGINPACIDGILVTHDHIDHTRAVGILSRKYDMPVYANAVHGFHFSCHDDYSPPLIRITIQFRAFEIGRAHV